VDDVIYEQPLFNSEKKSIQRFKSSNSCFSDLNLQILVLSDLNLRILQLVHSSYNFHQIPAHSFPRAFI
jgi:hypothetical protein